MPREVTPVEIPRPEVTNAWTAPRPARAEAVPSPREPANDPAAAAAERERTLKSALSHVDVVVYTTSWCPACKQARSWMNANGISYNERDIEQDRDAHEKLKRITGATTIPTFDIEGQVHVGLSPSWVQSTIRSVAERRLARDNL
jgi:glutaredoxin